eukprot:7755656-Pyramimonas_sp.AAC.1
MRSRASAPRRGDGCRGDPGVPPEALAEAGREPPCPTVRALPGILDVDGSCLRSTVKDVSQRGWR